MKHIIFYLKRVLFFHSSINKIKYQNFIETYLTYLSLPLKIIMVEILTLIVLHYFNNTLIYYCWRLDNTFSVEMFGFVG